MLNNIKPRLGVLSEYPCDTLPVNGTCYWHGGNNNNITYKDALDECERHDGTLAKVYNEELLDILM